MRLFPFALSIAMAASGPSGSAQAQPGQRIVVFSQPGFPVVESEPVSPATLVKALGGAPVFATVDQLRSGSVLGGASLLVMPYGSAVPVAAWASIERYLGGGGNLLLLGGQPLRVPVLGDMEGGFTLEAPQDSFSRAIDFRHSYAVPLGSVPNYFAWRDGYSFLAKVVVRARKVFAEEGRLQGLGYLDAADGMHLAAPVIVADHSLNSRMPGARIVALPFTPATGYWDSPDGTRLIRAAAQYAAAGATSFFIEAQYSTLRPGDLPEFTLHLRQARNRSAAGVAKVGLFDSGKLIDTANISLGGTENDVAIPFHKPLAAGTYTIRATWTPAGAGTPAEAGTPAAARPPQEYAENGLEVEDLSTLEGGATLAAHGDFLSLGGAPFFPVGTNYFTTEENGWDFSSPRNAAVWEQDFADMERHGVNFVRTGVWMSNGKFVEPITGQANERFLRNLEAFLAAAHRHNIAVNFTCFAFTPRVGEPRGPTSESVAPPNPYLDPATVQAEQDYVLSVVSRFRKVPWLSYDLINEPSFSNPRLIFRGNVPNHDPAEAAAWHTWLEQRYSSLTKLADTWRVTPEELGDWKLIPLPKQTDLVYDRYGNAQEVRALDYNLFAQDMFSQWVRGMVGAIRSTGSKQLVDVGQDEGGVTNRVLNQFYATAGVSFTTNHTYWQDESLLWDSVAAKRPGLPNITGETGYQPAWNPDGTWRYDELTGAAIEERKWALGFAAGSSGAMQWDWAREVDFGMQRSDGSAKIWENMMRDLGHFAGKAAPYATGLTLPEVAIVLPQSLQLSVYSAQALEAQQTAVRVLYNHNRAEAYAVGEYQTDTLGAPRLIILPSAYGLAAKAWADIEARVRAGAVLLISGPFGADAHLHPTGREKMIGLPVMLEPLQLHDETLHSPAGDSALQYSGIMTTILDRAALPDGKTWAEVSLGQGKVLFSVFPLELNGNLNSVAEVYAYALKTAGVSSTYTTVVKNPGILICPTRLPHATLYVLTSETETTPVSFKDTRSNKTFSGRLGAGRAALLLIGEKGELLASYGWAGDNSLALRPD